MAGIETYSCSPCGFRDILSEPVSWCIECEEFLCVTCKKHHLFSKRLKLHNVIPLEERQTLPDIAKRIRETCVEHDRKYELYCSDHEALCCIKCNFTSHKSCKKVSPIEDIISNVKSSVAITNIEEGLDALLSKTDVIKHKTEESCKENKVRGTEIKKSITVQQCMLEEASRNATRNVDIFLSDYEKKTSEVIESVDEKRNAIRSIKRKLSQLKDNGSDLQVFVCLKEFEAMLSKQEDILTTSIDHGEFDLLEIRYETSNELKDAFAKKDIGEMKTLKRTLELGLGSLGQTAKLASQQKLAVIKNIDGISLEKKWKYNFQIMI